MNSDTTIIYSCSSAEDIGVCKITYFKGEL